MSLLKIVFVIGCVALSLTTSVRAEGRRLLTEKTTKALTAKDPAKPTKPEATKEKDTPEAEVTSASETSVDSTTANKAAAPQGGARWEFAVAPYAFFAALDGRVGVVGQTAQVDASFSDIFKNLDFAAMGAFEARKGNWSFVGDAMYMSLSGKRVTPSRLFSDIDVEVKEFVFDPVVAYRVLKTERGHIDLLGGARIWHVKSHLTFQPLILPLVDVEESKNWVDPIVGARGVVSLAPRVFLTGRFDMGGFGINSDFTGQAFGGLGYQLKPRVALIGGYKYLRVDYVNEGFIFKTAMSGLAVGAKFNF
jgi:hypothetical protein